MSVLVNQEQQLRDELQRWYEMWRAEGREAEHLRRALAEIASHDYPEVRGQSLVAIAKRALEKRAKRLKRRK